jgi:chromosome partitioning protein
MIILMGGRKGGPGKTTLATNLAVYLKIAKKKDVIIVDADHQSTATRWSQDRIDNNLEPITTLQASENIKENLLELAKKYEIVIVDTAGRDSKEQRTAMITADIMIVPVRPSQFDLDTMPEVIKIYKEAKDFNEKLKCYVVLSMCPTHPLVHEREEAVSYIKDYPEIKLLKSYICDRKIYRDVASAGQGVWESNNEKAKNEIKDLTKEILL